MKELRAVLTKDISYLYILAFLLTGDQNAAMQCVVSGLEDCVGDNSAFQHWAHNWSKRTIIRNAIAMMDPTPVQAEQPAVRPSPSEAKTSADALIAAVIQLPVFDRFVFVISVLEGYSDSDSALLLQCTPEEISASRVRVYKNLTVPGLGSPAPAKLRSWPGAMLSQAIALFTAIGSLL